MNQRTRTLFLSCSLLLSLAPWAWAATLYVNASNPAPAAPYTDWTTAATNIQDAVDAAAYGDLVLVTNGIYQYGGRVIYYATTNRVAVTKPLTLESVNGPEATAILGTTNAVRCVYLTNGAVMAGFTLTNGNAKDYGGGAWCEAGAVVSNCVITSCTSAYLGGGAFSGTLNNCVLSNNYAAAGGAGAYSGTLNNCVLTLNSTPFRSGGLGAGAYNCTLNNCTLTHNSSGNSAGGAFGGTLNNCLLSHNNADTGGGAYNSTLNNCTLNTNSASYGGGTYGCTLSNCTLVGNSATFGGGAYSGSLSYCRLTSNRGGNGGGANSATLTNCALNGNSAQYGGGTYDGTLNNCILRTNSATSLGGGNYGGMLYNCMLNGNSNTVAAYLGLFFNCTVAGNTSGGVLNAWLSNSIVYDNPGGNFDSASSALSYCCTTPLPGSGIGNFTNAPLLVNEAGGDLHLQAKSPCINAGNNSYAASPTDLDGNPRISGGTVDVGAYEFQNPASSISYAWLLQYGLPTDGSADFVDSDSDGMNNRQEWIAGTNPTNAASVLKMYSPTNAPSGLRVSWQTITNRTYYLQRSTNPLAQPAFSTIQSNLIGQAGTTSYTDTNAPVPGPAYYRVGVQ